MNRGAAQIAAVDQLAGFAASLRYSKLPEDVRARLPLLMTDLLGVAAAGARTPELTALRKQWQPGPGAAPLIGTEETTTAETAAYLNAVAACCLELDEGNKHAQGHPAVQVVFAAMAAVQLAQRRVSGIEFLTAVVAGYEVAARFGRALTRNKEWHTHGHWGAPGAACAAALIRRGTQKQIAAAIDASTGLMHVTPWTMVLEGNFTRNLWAAGANAAGLNAARLAMCGLVNNSGAVGSTLGGIVGSLDADELVDNLGSDWLITQGYCKQHASCSYTHAAVDIVQALKRRRRITPADISDIEVKTSSLAAPLFQRDPQSRLAAMFSLPFVVGAAVLNEALSPAAMEADTGNFEAARQLSTKVRVSVDPAYDRLLPTERWTSVVIHFLDGSAASMDQPNPIGDTDYYPFGAPEIDRKLHSLLGESATGAIRSLVEDLQTCEDATRVLSKLSAL